MQNQLFEEEMNPFIDKYKLVRTLEVISKNTDELFEYRGKHEKCEEYGKGLRSLGYIEGKHLTILMLMLTILEGQFDADFEDEDEDGGDERNNSNR